MAKVFDKGTRLGPAHPCAFCIDKMKKFGIKKIYYTNDAGNWSSIGINAVELIYFPASIYYAKNITIPLEIQRIIDKFKRVDK